MLRLVTTNNVEVFRHLGSASFQRLGVDHQVGATYDQALALIRQLSPTIAIVDVELAGGSGYDLCRAVKDDPELGKTHVILILSSVITRPDLERIEASGCDDVLALPIYNDDFYHHLAQIADLPFRRDRRVGVTLECLIPDGATPVAGTVFNVSAHGVGVQIPAMLDSGQEIGVRFRHDGKVFPETRARVAWTRPASTTQAGEPEQLAGLNFDDSIPIQTRLLLEQLSLFDVVPAPESSPMAGGVTVALQGDFTEVTDFSALAQRLEHERLIDFNASAVRYISSAGVRGWCQFLKGLDPDKSYTFRHCSIAFASQAAMVPMVIGDGEVLSLEAPYFCESCDREELRLLETRALLHDGDHVIPPQLSCSVCSGELEFDDVPDRYFAFLRPQT